TDENAPITIDLLKNDTFADGAKITEVTQGSHGTITITADNKVIYTPTDQSLAAGESQTDSFTYTVTTIAGNTETATVTVTYDGANDAPLWKSDAVGAVKEDAAASASTTGTLARGEHFTDADISDNSFTTTGIKYGATDGVVDGSTYLQGAYGKLTIDQNGNYTYKADTGDSNAKINALEEGEKTDDIFTATISDGKGGSVDIPIVITVTGTNDAPQITVEPATTDNDSDALTEDAPLTASHTLTLKDVDVKDIVHVKVIEVKANGVTNGLPSDNDALKSMLGLPPGPVLGDGDTDKQFTWHFNAGNEKFDYLANGETLELTYTVQATDSQNASDTHQITITITGTNDAPIVSAITGEVAEDADKTAAQNDALFVSGNVITDHVTDVDVSDIHAISAVDGEAAKVGSVVNGAYGDITISADGSYKYTLRNDDTNVQALAENETHDEVFTVTVSDGHGGTTDQTITVTVHGTNDAPTAVNNEGSVVEDTRTITNESHTTSDGNILKNDADVDNAHTLTVFKVADSEANVNNAVTGVYGSVTIKADGTYTYDLDNANANVQALRVGETITDTFNVVIKDEHGATASETLTITITGTNDAPVISLSGTDSDSAGLTETNAALTTAGTLSVSDVDTKDSVTPSVTEVKIADSGTFDATKIPQETLNKLLSMLAVDNSAVIGNTANDGTINWNFNSGTETFNFLPKGETIVIEYVVKATDDSSAANNNDAQTITITITGTDDAPAVAPDTSNADEDVTQSGNVLTNDTDDPDYGEGLVVTKFRVEGDLNEHAPGETVTIDKVGSLTLKADGSWTFTPVQNYHGSVPVVTYTVTNGLSSSVDTYFTADSTLTITINPEADAPSLVDIDKATPEDTAVALGLTCPSVSDSLNGERLGAITIDGIDNGCKLTKADGTSLYTSPSDNGSVKIIIVGTSGTTAADTTLHYSGIDTTGAIFLTREEFAALKFIPAADSHNDVDMKLKVDSYEVDKSGNPLAPANSANTTIDIHVEVQAVTDDVALEFDTGATSSGVDIDASSTSDNGILTIKEDATFNLKDLLTKTFNDTDGSEGRTITLSGIPKGTTINGTTINIDNGTWSAALDKDGAMPDIKVTPGKNYSGDFSQITVTLSAKDTDSDSTVTTVTESDSITLVIHVDPVAGDVSAGDVTTTEDSAVDFLKNLKLTDGDNSEKITSITVNDVPAGWAIYDSAGNLVFTGDGAKNYSIAAADITGNKYADYKILPPKNSSADAKLNITVGTEDTGNGKTDTADKALDIKVTVTPIAERVQETGDPTPADSNHELKMNDDHAYTTPGTEDTWFDLKTDGVDLKTPWKNLDTDNSGAEKTYALFTPVLTNGIAGESAIGSYFRYSTDGGTTWIEIKYTGEPIKIESQYLDSVEFKAPDNVSGTFKIGMQAYTEDFDADTGTKVTNTSGAAELTDIVIAPVPDGIYTIAAAQAKGEEDTFINLSIKPASVDPSETFNVTIDGVPKDATIKYDGVEYTATSPNVSGSGITVVKNADGSFKITIDNFDTTKLFIRPPTDSNVDFDLTVTGVSVDGAATSTPYPATGGITLHVDVVGVADDVTVVNNPVASGTTAFTEAQAETGGIPISSFIVKQADKTDTSEIVTVRITGLQEGFSLSGANVQFLGGTGAGRSWLVTNPTDKDFITTPPNFSGEIKFQAQAVSTENDGNSKQSSMTDVTVVVTPTPEAAIHSSVEASEDVLTQVSFDVVHNNGDTDETVAYVLLKITDVDGNGGKHFTLSYSENGTTGQSLAAAAAGNITGITIENGYYKISGDAMGKIFIKGAQDWSGSETFEVKYGITDFKNAEQTAAIDSVTSESDLTGGYKVT
ncbi:MAG: VCBS domain-containing protein, partial [Cloacibacillus sp.]